MKVLVTGHEGFIGQHLCAELKAAGHDVCGHDRGDGDLTHPGAFAAAVRDAEPDRVVHLAAQVGRDFGEADVHHTITANVTMTAVVARSCGARGIPVLYASTSEVYGDQGDAVCREDGPLRRAHNLYGMTKLMGEEALRLYAPDGLRVVRLSMPYGPGAPPGRGRRAMDNFLWWAHHRMPITVHRGAERSWCWVGDTVRGIRLVLERGEHEVYNVGRDDRPLSMLDLAVRACLLTGAPGSLIRHVDAPGRQTVVKRLDTGRLRGLGWAPTVELEDGMRDVLAWVRRYPAPVVKAA
jgi:nucleoside-diphosphate-sugar epimerase